MKDIPKSPRLIEMKHNRQKRILRLLSIFLTLFVVIIGALGYFSFNRHLMINKIVVSGVQIIAQSEVENFVQNNLKGRYFYIFSKANSFIYPHREIYNNLQKTFTRIETLSVYKEGLNNLNIDISERMGAFLYCGSLVPEEKREIGENCYFINNDGYIFDEAPYFSGDIYFKYYIAFPEEEVKTPGSQMLEPENFHELSRFIDGITSLGFNPTYLTIGVDGLYSLYLKTDTELKPKIIFKNENNLENILDDFSIAMNQKEFKDEINTKYNKLLYIDLRFKNKVLYKFQ